MKCRFLILALLISFCSGAHASADPINEPRSPLLKPLDPVPGGVWLPGTFVGGTGLVLDLNQVGTNQMVKMKVEFPAELRPVSGETNRELRPLYGENFEVHSDQTIRDEESGRSERTVILVDRKSYGEWNRKMILRYKVSTTEDRFTSEGVKLTGAGTHYALTVTGLLHEYEVLYHFRFGESFPNAEHPNLTRAPLQDEAEGGAPTKPESTP